MYSTCLLCKKTKHFWHVFNILQIYLQVAVLGLFVLMRYMYWYWCTFIIITTVVCNTTCITSAPWTRKMPSRSPCPKAAEARGRRPGAGHRRAWGSRGHFGGRCCLTAEATTDHSPDASRLRHPGTSNKVQ